MPATFRSALAGTELPIGIVAFRSFKLPALEGSGSDRMEEMSERLDTLDSILRGPRRPVLDLRRRAAAAVRRRRPHHPAGRADATTPASPTSAAFVGLGRDVPDLGAAALRAAPARRCASARAARARRCRRRRAAAAPPECARAPRPPIAPRRRPASHVPVLLDEVARRARAARRRGLCRRHLRRRRLQRGAARGGALPGHRHRPRPRRGARAARRWRREHRRPADR